MQQKFVDKESKEAYGHNVENQKCTLNLYNKIVIASKQLKAVEYKLYAKQDQNVNDEIPKKEIYVITKQLLGFKLNRIPGPFYEKQYAFSY